MKKTVRKSWLLVQFLKMGFFTFGGGWSIVAQMQSIFVDETGLLSSEELTDLTSVARSLPGTMVGNVSAMVGYHLAGIPGALLCVFGIAFPPLATLSVITYFYTQFRESAFVKAALSGIRAAVAPIIFCAALRMMKAAYRYRLCIAITAASLILYLFFSVSGVWLVLGGIVCGLVISGLL